MDIDKQIELAQKNLERVLSFFSRVEAKASTLFAVNTGMMGLLALNLRWIDLQYWYVVLLACTSIFAIFLSFWFLYLSGFPRLKGGARSLIFFGAIALLSTEQYITEIRKIDRGTLLDDLLEQVRTNSVILAGKFSNVKHSFLATAAAVPLWFTFLAATAVIHASLILH